MMKRRKFLKNNKKSIKKCYISMELKNVIYPWSQKMLYICGVKKMLYIIEEKYNKK